MLKVVRALVVSHYRHVGDVSGRGLYLAHELVADVAVIRLHVVGKIAYTIDRFGNLSRAIAYQRGESCR